MDMKITGNEPAYPTEPPKHNGLSGEEYGLNYGRPGLTILQELASRQMAAIRQGFLASGIAYLDSYWTSDKIAQTALQDAKALIAELNKQP